MLYIVNRKYHYTNLGDAIVKAKTILEERAIEPINRVFKITIGRKGGYCVALLDNWGKSWERQFIKSGNTNCFCYQLIKSLLDNSSNL